MSQMVEVTIPQDQLDEFREELRKQLPTALIGTKDKEDGTISVIVTLYSETPEVLQRIVSALGSDQVEVKGAPSATPSLSALVSKAKAAAREPDSPGTLRDDLGR